MPEMEKDPAVPFAIKSSGSPSQTLLGCRASPIHCPLSEMRKAFEVAVAIAVCRS